MIRRGSFITNIQWSSVYDPLTNISSEEIEWNSSIFSSNFEASASELLENIEDIFPLNYVDIDMLSIELNNQSYIDFCSICCSV